MPRRGGTGFSIKDYRPSELGNYPGYACITAMDREKNIELYSQRVLSGLDIWTGTTQVNYHLDPQNRSNNKEAS